MENMPLLSIRNLKTYIGTGGPPVKAVDGADLEIEAGETFGLVGESGCGKTILALSIARLLPPGGRIISGQIQFERQELTQRTEEQLRALRGGKIAYIFQDPMSALNPVMNVQEQLLETIRQHRQLTGGAASDLAVELLRQAQIPDPQRRLHQYPHELSGGLRQRVMIAMALSGNPSLLIADEATTALDVTTQAEILSLLKNLQKKIGMGILLITHDLLAVAPLSDRIAVMRAGRIVETARTPELYKNPTHPYTQTLLNCLPKVGQGKQTSRVVPGDPLLETIDLRKRFSLRSGAFTPQGWLEAVRGVSIKIRAGESVCLVGESGCGKTTLARLLCRLDLPTHGFIRYRGENLQELRGKQLRRFRRSVQLIFQDPMASLNPLMRIGQIVAEPLIIHRLAQGKDLEERVGTLLGEVGLDPSLASRFPQSLSGGQRQRVGIARALSMNPELLICDEPVSSLDLSVQAQILKLLTDLQAKRGLSLFFISHNLAVVSALADRILVMREGQILEEGTNPELFRSPRNPYTQTLVNLAMKTI